MQRTAKVFMNGRSQAVRLPSEFRFDCDEVNVRKDPKTGDVILSQEPKSLASFFKLLEEIGPGEAEFLVERDSTTPTDRKLF